MHAYSTAYPHYNEDTYQGREAVVLCYMYKDMNMNKNLQSVFILFIHPDYYIKSGSDTP